MPAEVGVGTLEQLLERPGEFAIVDAREQGAYSEGHLLHAVNIPRSRLELRLADLVPRRDTPIVVVDGDDGVAADAASTIEELGWTDVAVLTGGTDAWEAAGGELYSGVNVPSKLFGELVEQIYDTPHVSAAELAAWQREGRDLVILDSRTEGEFRRMSIPGGRSCPGGELVHRIFDLAPNPSTTVVVNCAGRTRSILGAQTLRNAGIPNPVVALENGTMGWELAGLELDHGSTMVAPRPTAAGRAKAISAATEVARRFGVERATSDDIDVWEQDTSRTTYVLDVRTPDEFEAAHRAGSRNAPGGQLVQATDEYIGTRNARIVLVDDDGTRASMTGSWLRQLGWDEVYTVSDVTRMPHLEHGPRDASPAVPPVERIRPDDLSEETIVIDLASSRDHERAHIPGALWAVRGRLGEAAQHIGEHATVVLTSPDGTLAALAVEEAIARFPRAERVAALAGGTAAWRRSGRPIEQGMVRPTTETDDVWSLPYDPRDAASVRRSMEAYLVWEIDLVDQYQRDRHAKYPLLEELRPGA